MDGGIRQHRLAFRGGVAAGIRNAARADDGIELSLGLSTNGRFGMDPGNKRLRRSSSVSDLLARVVSYDNGVVYPAARGASAPLARASSVPAEGDENRMRDLQVRRSTEARRQRVEKMRVLREMRQFGDGEGSSGGAQRIASGVFLSPPPGFEDHIPTGVPTQGLSGSSSVDLLQGTYRYSASNASSSVQILHNEVVQVPAIQAARNGARTVQASSNGANGNGNGNGTNEDDEELKKALLDMPYVATKGFGPNHAKIEGFLYRYRTGDDVKIVCVCHGLFLSPAEFVKHGGGGELDVAQPLRSIMVIPFPFP